MGKVGVVILNWNGEALFDKFLPSVVAHSPKELADVVVIDNGSTDNSIQLLKNNYPEVQIIELKENYGFAEGYNRGLKELNHDNVVLLNSDVEVTPGWLLPLIEVLESNPDVMAVQPKILDHKNKSRFEYAGACGGFIDKYGFPFCRGRILETVEEDQEQYNHPIPIFWASGAAIYIRREKFFDVGGFDDSFFAHMEEIDLCWRIIARGGIILSEPKSTVYHYGGATLSTDNPRKLYLNFRNNLLMLYKNLPREYFLRVMVARYVLDSLAALKLFLFGKPLSALSVVKAHLHFLKIKHKYRDDRNENINKAVNLYLPQVLCKSIIFEYYFRGGRTFSKLRF